MVLFPMIHERLSNEELPIGFLRKVFREKVTNRKIKRITLTPPTIEFE